MSSTAEHSVIEQHFSRDLLPSPTFSGNDEEAEDDQGRDYSTRMEELLSDEHQDGDAEVDEDDGGFVYDGVDADQVTSDNYRDQLRDVLGPEDSYDEYEEQEVEQCLLQENNSVKSDELLHRVPRVDIQTDVYASTATTLAMSSVSTNRVASPAPIEPFSPFPKPFLHPNVSRLRSFSPRDIPAPSAGLAMSGFSPSPSHFSDISQTSSPSAGLRGLLLGHEREVFRWTSLRSAGSHFFNQRSVIGAPLTGTPVVLAVNGFICVGTDEGRIFVFDFKQTLKCICGSDSSASTVGPVSAVALSNDHTFIASGHTTGCIQLFDLKNPQVAARTVTPATLGAITSGRQEGHLPGSRIISISFVAGRHTAVVSADHQGLSFYHSLGKVLFVQASDTIRIFGNYHGEDAPEGSIPGHPVDPSSKQNALDQLAFRRKRRPRNTILAMCTLPLGPLPHPTDAYQIVALLTPTKLVIVGLKPNPKTWLKLMRDEEQLSSPPSYRRRGCLAWFPSVEDISTKRSENVNIVSMKNAKNKQHLQTHPFLSYSWGNRVYLIRVFEQKTKQTVSNSRTGKMSEVLVGTLVFEEAGKWTMDDVVLAIQWLNPNQLAIFTASTLSVYDAHTMKMVDAVQFDSSSLASPSLGCTGNGAITYSESVRDIAHSVRAYKGKLFLLGRQELFIGTLLSWADRILSFVEQGDFLNAIELTRTYYTGEAPGNRNGLPEDPEERQSVIGDKINEIMMASSRYAFSEDRMTDGTHASFGGRGIDRTSLFEDLIATCARACIAMDDFDFLFEELFQQYENAGIHRMFLHQLEPFVLDGSIPFVPPRITQRLVALHDEDGRPDLAERIIWHIEPSCLDINQAINLCRAHQLWDALVYVYTRALRDYVSPIVEFLGLIRGLQQDRTPAHNVVKNAYKIYSYLATVLCGQIYPSQEALQADEAFLAKRDAYSFVFCGHSTIWPAEGGSLVLTSQEESGMEPTYPYVRLLLRFDSESFLHCLDMAFEDSYLNESSHGMSRLMIVKILLDIMSSGGLSLSDATFVNIFIARNVPKYPQFIQVAPSVLHNILTALATEPAVETREDRQLAAEYLLSVYTPHDGDELLHLFEDAGFYRILRSLYRHERHWGLLLTAFLRDPELCPSEMFSGFEEVFASSARDNKEQVPSDVIDIFTTSLPKLLQSDVRATAALVDTHAPQLHDKALECQTLSDDRDQFIYLGHLVHGSDLDQYSPTPNSSSQVNSQLRHRFIRLQCRFAPFGVIDVLEHLQDGIDWTIVMGICEEAGAYDAVIWAVNHRGQPREALTKADMFEKQLTLDLARIVASPASDSTDSVYKCLTDLQTIGRRGIAICMEHSRSPSPTEVPLEDIWYQLLSSQIHTVQILSACCFAGEGGDAVEGHVLSTLRAIVQETFASLVLVSSTQAVSFPRLFKRLVDHAVHSGMTGTPYTEFRAILTGMLESYRTDGDMLIISKHLIDRDVFDFVELYAKEKMRGWTPSRGVCSSCGRTALTFQTDVENVQIKLSRTGTIYHLRCLTSD